MPIARCGTESGAIDTALSTPGIAPRPRAIANAIHMPSAVQIAVVAVAALRLTQREARSSGEISWYQRNVRSCGGNDSIAALPTEEIATNASGASRNR